MSRLPAFATRVVVGVVVVAIVVTALVYFVFSGSSEKKVTAQFASAVGVYPGTPVRILGINVGTVDSVTPKGNYVAVTMTYDSSYQLPGNVTAQEVANSLVSDRYIQLTPALNTPLAKDGIFPDNGTIPTQRTGGPAELDDIYAALNKLSVALGPSGANQGGTKSGALSELLTVAAANLKGNGSALGQSITNLSAAAKTLADQRNGLFGTGQNLQKFVSTLKASDAQVRLFNEQLAQVAGELAGERGDLGAALHDLGIALDDVATFVKDNAGKLHVDIQGLEQILGVLVQQKASLNETLAVGPYALANIVHAYQPDLGVIASRGNLASLFKVDPQQVLCSLLETAQGGLPGALGSLTGQLLGPVTKACGKAGATAAARPLTSSSTTTALPTLVGAGS